MPEIGWAGLGVVPEVDSGFYSKLSRDVDPHLARVGKSSGSRFGSILGKSAALAAGGAVAAGFAAFQLGKGAVSQASDLNESLNAVNVTYGKQAGAVADLGEKSAEALGLSNAEFNGLAVQFAAFSKTIAGDGGNVVGTLDDLATRGADFASVMNLEVNEALALFQSGLAGETEPLRKYGIDLSAAAVEAHALKVGITDGKDALTEAEKVQSRYSLLMQSTNKTAGDFANTSDSLANQQRILNARWDDAQAKLGTALLPILEDVTGFLLDEGIPAFEKFSDWFTTDGIDGLRDFGNFTKNEVLPVVKDLGGFLIDVADAGGDVVKFINDLPGSAKLAGLAAVLGGVGAMKLRGGGGALGAIGSAAGLTKPVPVFVTNPGGIGGKPGTPVVPGAVPGRAPVGALPKFAPLIPVGLGSAPGSDSAMYDLLGFGLKSDQKDTAISAWGHLGEAAFGLVGDAASAAGADIIKTFNKLPKTVATRFDLLGVPESERELRKMLRAYDLTPKQKRTTLELLGYDVAMDRLARLNKELDWVTRPRQARIDITRNYADAGYETRGGLQQFGGGPVAPRNSGGFGP